MCAATRASWAFSIKDCDVEWEDPGEGYEASMRSARQAGAHGSLSR